jgi:peroxiredoxin
LFAAFFLCETVWAEKTVIRGQNQTYAGQKLTFQVYSNQISKQEKEIASTEVKPDGSFEVELDLAETEYVFCHAGVFFLYMYAVPGEIYTIKLPQRADKKPEEKLNPYFEEIKLHLLVLSYQNSEGKTGETTKELNFYIRSFDDYFDPYYSKYAANLYSAKVNPDMDTTLSVIHKTFGDISDPYFQNYYFYRLGLLKFLSTRFKSRNISDKYFLNKPVLYDNIAYMELFNQVYEKYLVYFGRTTKGKVVYDNINIEKSFSKLKLALAQDEVLSNDTLKELVILKGLHDGCYEMEFSRQAMVQILDSVIQQSVVVQHRVIAAEIRAKVTRLMMGYTPPSFRLLNQDSIWVSPSDFKGKNVYLVFCTTQNYACLKDFTLLKKLKEKFGKYFEIVAICADDSFEAMRRFAKTSGYDWTFLFYGDQAELLKDYDIRVFPTYFFMNREGSLVMSPARTPQESFEMDLFQFLRSKGEI